MVPNFAPNRSSDEKNTTKEILYLRWFLESSFNNVRERPVVIRVRLNS
jgi:hypothetical protein